MRKFNIGDKVWDMRTMDVGEVIEIDSDNDIKVQYKGYCSFYNIDGKVSYNDFCPTIRLVGEDIIIKSPVLPPEPPQRAFKDIIKDINKCRKKFVVGEDNCYIEISHTKSNTIDDIETSTYKLLQYGGLQCYTKEVKEFVKEIKELNFKSLFVDWVNGKTMDYNSVAPAPEGTVQPEIPCDEYPELTGREEIGTVGYVAGCLVKIVADKEHEGGYFVCNNGCDLTKQNKCGYVYDICAERHPGIHFKLYKA